jgi:hypothetical protein
MAVRTVLEIGMSGTESRMDCRSSSASTLMSCYALESHDVSGSS